MNSCTSNFLSSPQLFLRSKAEGKRRHNVIDIVCDCRTSRRVHNFNEGHNLIEIADTSPLEQENEHLKNQVSLVENNSIVLSNSSYLKNTN